MATSMHRVTATELNLRSAPDPTKKNRIATLVQGTLVEKLATAAVTPWWKVATTVGGQALEGFVNSDFLVPAGAAPEVAAVSSVGEAHLRRDHPTAKRNSDAPGSRAHPLNDKPHPPALSGTAAERAAQLVAIIEWAGVDGGARWQPGAGLTFCNIYAHDIAFVAGAYIPRAWWTGEALQKLQAGQSVTPTFGTTVRELNANALTNWFETHGGGFGWRRTFDLTELQDAANAGRVCVIVAHNANSNRSGHIQIVAPEHGGFAAKRSGGKVTNPLQSQAGAKNFQFGHLPANWFADSAQFSKHGLWICG